MVSDTIIRQAAHAWCLTTNGCNSLKDQIYFQLNWNSIPEFKDFVKFYAEELEYDRHARRV